MLVNLLTIILISIGCLLIVSVPWIILYEELRSRETNGLAVMISGLLCLFEIAAVLDWFIGLFT